MVVVYFRSSHCETSSFTIFKLHSLFAVQQFIIKTPAIFEYGRVREANGGPTILPLVNPNHKFLLLDSLAWLGLEKVDFTKG
jgi:hypothetical protein